jgi:hypothetical protein
VNGNLTTFDYSNGENDWLHFILSVSHNLSLRWLENGLGQTNKINESTQPGMGQKNKPSHETAWVSAVGPLENN